jgi:hypothetical protein
MSAQEAQFLPEIDAYLKFQDKARLNFQAKDTREGGLPTHSEVGPSIEFYTKPLLSLDRRTTSGLDDARARPLILSAGYRILTAPGSPLINRVIFAGTSQLPLPVGWVISDRSRVDLDWKTGSFEWRYRNKLAFARTLRLRSYHPTLYASAEVYYESVYTKWSTTEIYAGCRFPVGRHVVFDSYYEHQNNTGKSPNEQLHGIGLVANLYFSARR